MPFTPFHFGPGALAKSVAPRWFSFRAFVLCQVVVDIETAWNIYRASDRIHTFFHSYIGVTVAMAATGALLVVYNLVGFRIVSPRLSLESKEWGALFKFPPSLTAILFGGWSHVFLDSVMHSDMLPLLPFARTNPILDLVSMKVLHMGCLWSFVGAGAVWAVRVFYQHLRDERGR